MNDSFLILIVAPTIDYNATSSDISVDERHRLSIRCHANGHPIPTIVWRREDNKDINLGLYGGKRYSGNLICFYACFRLWLNFIHSFVQIN